MIIKGSRDVSLGLVVRGSRGKWTRAAGVYSLFIWIPLQPLFLGSTKKDVKQNRIQKYKKAKLKSKHYKADENKNKGRAQSM